MRIIIPIVVLVFCLLQVNAQKPGSITDTITCQENLQQRYALYLPKDYVNTKHYPLLLFFDPGARAQVPLKNYSALADRYQLIMACSYQSRNGPYKPSIEAANAMLKDITEHFSINTSFI